jgi:hypothetical protein
MDPFGYDPELRAESRRNSVRHHNFLEAGLRDAYIVSMSLSMFV